VPFRQPLVLAPAVMLLMFALGGPLRQLGLHSASNAMPAISIALVCLALLTGVANRRRGVQFDRLQFADGPFFGAFLRTSARQYFFPVLLFTLTFKLEDQTIGFMISRSCWRARLPDGRAASAPKCSAMRTFSC
jgi:hypothetical protein